VGHHTSNEAVRIKSKTFPVEESHESFRSGESESARYLLREKVAASREKPFWTFKFTPAMGNTFDDWIRLPTGTEFSSGILFNSITLPLKWVVWTTKGLAGLPPHQSLRERLCNQSSSLGSVAGLYLVIAISAFFLPPSKSVTSSLPGCAPFYLRWLCVMFSTQHGPGQNARRYIWSAHVLLGDGTDRVHLPGPHGHVPTAGEHTRFCCNGGVPQSGGAMGRLRELSVQFWYAARPSG
jgi:hypothetical protein